MVLWRQLLAFNPRVQLCVRNNSAYFKVHRFEPEKSVQEKSKMADQNEPLIFNSRSKPPHDKFSNFYEATIAMPEGVFGSVEHYFHAMKFINDDHSRFEINGDLGKRKFESGSWKESVSSGRFIKSAGGKAGTEKYKLTLQKNGLDRENAKQTMKKGLQRKFETEPFRSLLLKTHARALVHTPMRGKTDYWTGRVDKASRSITGENNMGKLLMEVRKELQKAPKSSHIKENIANDEIKGVDENKSGGENIADDENKDDVEIKGVDENKGDGENESDDEKKVVDENKSDGENEAVDENIADDENKGVDEIKGDDEDTTSETKDSSGYKGKKRKYKDEDDVEPKGPQVKRKKIENE